MSLLALLAASPASAQEPRSPEAAGPGEIPLTIYEVERGNIVSVPTQGMPRVLILNPSAVEVQTLSETEAVFIGLAIDSSLIHIWDQSGRRTVRIVVRELTSIVQEQAEREREAVRRKLGLPGRTLKTQYRGSHRNLERGPDLSFDNTHEQYRVRTHQIKSQMGIPQGLLVGDLYLEQRRDTLIGKEVTQPRHMSLALEKYLLGPLGEVDLIAGDKDVYWSDFTLPGRRYRGLGLFPTGTGLPFLKKHHDELEVSAFVGEEREGFGLDLQAGQQSRQARSQLAGVQVEYPLLQGFRVHGTGLHREGKGGDFRSDHVYELGFDVDKEFLKLDVDAARNGPEGAYQADLLFLPAKEVKMRNILWRVGKNYRTVTGNVARDGQTGWKNIIDWTLPYFDQAMTMSSGVTLYRDRNALNPVNPREWNSLYSLNSVTRLPYRTKLQAGVSHEDESGSSFPTVTRRVETQISRELPMGLPWLATVSPFIGYRYADFGKSRDIPGYDATLSLYRGGVRANFWRSIWGGISVSQGTLKEHEPEDEPNISHPREVVLEAGATHQFQTIPALADAIFRFVDVQETHPKVHQPFSDQNQVSGNFRFTWRFGKDREWFNAFSILRQQPETDTSGERRLIELFLETGVRLGWDTRWAPSRTGTVIGFVFMDLNANGKVDPEEPGIPQARVYVVGGPSTSTASDGGYTLRKVREGPAVVKVEWGEIPPGHFFTTSNTVQQLILHGKKTTVNFGVATEVEFRGIVFNDLDGDETFTAGEDLPVQGVRLNVETGQGATSGSTGHYSIRRIRPGEHTLTLDISTIPDGYQTLVPIRKSAELKEGDVVTFDVPLKAQRLLSGSVFIDTSENTLREQGETGVENVLIRVEAREALTDSEGNYQLDDVPHGKQQVQLSPDTIPAGLYLRSPPALEVDVPKEPYTRERLNFSLSAQDGPSFAPQTWGSKPLTPIEGKPAEEAEGTAIPEDLPEPPPVPAKVEPPVVPAEEQIRAVLDKVLPLGHIPQVIDAEVSDRYPEIGNLARIHKRVLIDRSDTYEQSFALVMQLSYLSVTQVHYYEFTFRSGWFRKAAFPARLDILFIQPKEDSLSLLNQILANAAGISEDELAGQVDLDQLASWLRGEQ